mgnify:CR=1 FL=1
MAARKRKVDVSDTWREKISTTMLMLRLKEHIDGKVQLESTQIKAIELILQRTVASLSSVEQTVHTADDILTDEQIAARFQGLIEAHPDLLQRLLAMQARVAPQQPAIVAGPEQAVPSTEPIKATG